MRIALTFLDGIRAGQSLGALLGYRLERGLHDRHAIAETDQFIGALRQAFPLVAAKLPETAAPAGTAIESLEARNVVDGLALVRHVTRTGQASYPFGLVGLPVADGVQTTAIDTEVQALVEINDALADLAVAEGRAPGGARQCRPGGREHGRVHPDGVPARAGRDRHPAHRAAAEPPRRAATAPGPVPGGLARAGAARHAADGRRPGGRALARRPAARSWRTSPAASRGPTRAPTPPAVRWSLRPISGLQPIDLLWLLRPTDQATMTELDDRIVARVMHTQTLRADTELVLRYTDPVPGKISLFQLSPLVDTLRRLLLAARPARPSDYTMPAGGDALDPQADDGGGPAPRPAEGGAGRAERVRGPDRRPDRRSRALPLADPVAHRQQLISGVDTFLTRYGDLLVTGGGSRPRPQRLGRARDVAAAAVRRGARRGRRRGGPG